VQRVREAREPQQPSNGLRHCVLLRAVATARHAGQRGVSAPHRKGSRLPESRHGSRAVAVACVAADLSERAQCRAMFVMQRSDAWFVSRVLRCAALRCVHACVRLCSLAPLAPTGRVRRRAAAAHRHRCVPRCP
jgi:hypothetical protein